MFVIDIMADTTTISLTRKTKKMLEELGSKGESFDDIVRRLVGEASIKKLDRRWNRILEKDEFIPLDEV